jgi:prevent-host-death family protein
MKSLEVRELEERITEILRMVQEQGEIIEVTNRGEVVARLIPAHKMPPAEDLSEDEIWTDLERFSAEISAHWPAGLSAVDAVRDAR